MNSNTLNREKTFNPALLPVIFGLAWPTMMEQVMQTAVQYIDTAMVGSLGTDATAAVGSTSTVNWLVGSSVSALGVGFLALISQSSGAGDSKRASRASGQSVLITIIAGIVFTILTQLAAPYVPVWMNVDPAITDIAARYFAIIYSTMLFRAAIVIFGTVLRAYGDTKTPMKAGILMNVVNVVLNYLMIYPTRTITIFTSSITMPGLGWGVIGAAVASGVSFIAGGVMITIAVFRKEGVMPEKFSIKPDWVILRPCLRIALPNMAQRFCTSLGYVIFASMINSLGEVSTAAHTIANTVESAFYIPGYGLSTASATLTGNAIGKGDETLRKQLSRMIWLCVSIMMCITGGALFVFAQPMVKIFTADAAVIVLASTVLKMVALSEPFFGISVVTEGMLMGAGQTKAPFIINLVGMWGVRIVGTFICTRFLGLGLESAWGCMIACNIVLMTLFVLYYNKGKMNTIY